MRRLHQTWFWRALWALRNIPRIRKRLAGLERKRRDPNKPALLVLNHFFDQEIKAMERSPHWSDRFELVVLDHWTFFAKSYYYYPPDVFLARHRAEDPRHALSARRNRAHAARVLDRLGRSYRVVGVLTPSDWSFWSRDFLREARARGLGTFVLDKEGILSSAFLETEKLRVLNLYPPVAEWFYVWSDRQRRFWEGVGVSPNKIRVLGSLRTDLFVNLPSATSTGVLFFDFEDDAYLNGLTPEERQRYPGDWRPLRESLHGILKEKIRAYPHVTFTIKCHPQQRDKEAVRASFRGVGANVRVEEGTQSVDEIVGRHSIAFGFQTTALMEVALTNRASVYCAWGPLHEQVRSRLVPLMEPGFGIHWCQSAEEFARLIDEHVTRGRSPPKPSKERLLATFFHGADGHVAERYAEALRRDLAKPAGPDPVP